MPAKIEQREEWARIHLSGELDIDDLTALPDDITAAATSGQKHFIFDLMEFRDCTADARRSLVELQRLVGEHGGRTAWISNRPHARGLALWACRFAEDGQAKVVSTEAQIKPWLQSRAQRLPSAVDGVTKTLQEIRERMRNLDPRASEAKKP